MSPSERERIADEHQSTPSAAATTAEEIVPVRLALLDQRACAPSLVAHVQRAAGNAATAALLTRGVSSGRDAPRFVQRVAGEVGPEMKVAPGLPGQGGSYRSALGTGRDANLNNPHKVAFENALTAAILRATTRNPQCAAGVGLVSRLVHQWMIQNKEQLATLVGGPGFFGSRPLDALPIEQYVPVLASMLATGDGPVHVQLAAQFHFKEVVLMKRPTARTKPFDIVRKERDASTVRLPGTAVNTRFSDARARKDVRKGMLDGLGQQAGGLGPAGSDIKAGVWAQHAHMRGTEQYATEEDKAFVQHARLVLDMPLSGAGLSGSAYDLMFLAKNFAGLGDEALKEYALGCVGYLVAAGAHSFHEVMAAVSLVADVGYEPGRYTGCLPTAFMASEEYRALASTVEYQPFVGTAAAGAQATTSTPMNHGTIPKTEADQRLQGRPDGTWLLRYSPSLNSHMIVSISGGQVLEGVTPHSDVRNVPRAPSMMLPLAGTAPAAAPPVPTAVPGLHTGTAAWSPVSSPSGQASGAAHQTTVPQAGLGAHRPIAPAAPAPVPQPPAPQPVQAQPALFQYDTKTAEAVLLKCAVGAWLARTCSKGGSYAVSRLVAKGVVEHYLYTVGTPYPNNPPQFSWGFFLNVRQPAGV